MEQAAVAERAAVSIPVVTGEQEAPTAALPAARELVVERPRRPIATALLGPGILAAIVIAGALLAGAPGSLGVPPRPALAPALPSPVPSAPTGPAVTEQPQPQQPAPAVTEKPAAKPAPAATEKPAAEPASKPAPKPAPKPAAKPAPKPEEAAQIPSIRIEKPAFGSSYYSSVLLAGIVTSVPGVRSASEIARATWEISGTGRTGALSLSGTGEFSATIPTDGLQDALNIVVRAERKDGGAAETSISLSGAGPGPQVAIVSSPVPYGSTVRLDGRVSGLQDAPDPNAEIDSATWSLQGTSLAGPVTLDASGAFSFSFSTVGEHGPLTVVVRVRDRNGRAATAQQVVPDRPGGLALRVDAPADNAEYADAVAVEGRAGDPDDPSGGPGEVASLSWQVVGTPRLSGSVTPADDGAFRFSVPTAGLTGPQVLELRVEDRNGRATVRKVTLVERPPAGRPVLVIDSPAGGSPYGASVVVKGKATNPASDAAEPLPSVSWSVEGTALAGTAAPGADGAFGFTVSMGGLHGARTLHVKAESRGGTTVDRVIQLIDPEAGPAVVVSSPGDGGYYRTTTVVEGKLADAAAMDALASLTWEVTGQESLRGRVSPGDDGAFRFAVPFAQLSGDVTLRLTAADIKGHTSFTDVRLHDGSLKPVITLTTPGKGGTYSSVLRVAGKIDDPYAGHPGMEGVASLSWTVAPVVFSRTASPLKGTATPGPAGDFRFSVSTQGLSGQQDLSVVAVGASGNRGDLTVRLTPGDSDLPSFSVTPGDGQATVTWDALPFVTRYEVAYAAGTGEPESGTVETAAAPPVTVTGLQIGALYSLRVKAVFDDGTTGTSPVARIVPLSPGTLAPTVRGDYQKIHVAWDAIPGATSFDVWRSTVATADFLRVAMALAATVYVDAAVQFGTTYYYAVSPAGVIAPRSAPSSGRSLAFPVEKLALAGAIEAAGARRVDVEGGYAFVSSGAAGVRIVDVSSPGKPSAVGIIPADDAWAVAVRGDYAFVADGANGLLAVDVSAPRKPVVLGSRKTSDARAVVITGNYAYVADGDKGLKVIDVSDARTLPRVGALETTDARDLAVAGTSLFVADGAGGLEVVDITRPTQPVVSATLTTSDARGIAVIPGLALVADGAAGLRIIDVSDPRKPALVATFAGAPAAAVSAEESFAYVTDPAGGIRVVDLEDPAHPSLFATHAMPGAAGIGVLDRYAYIADGGKLQIMAVQIQGRSFRIASAATAGKAFGVAIDGTWAYVAGHAGGLTVLDAGDPAGMSDASLVGSLATRFAVSVSVQDALAFVADGDSGLRIVDVSPTWARAGKQPVDVGSYRPGGTVSRVIPSGTVVYVAAGGQGFRVLDVKTPSAPLEIGNVRTRNASDIVLDGRFVWLADGDGGVRVIDVSTPNQPKLLSATIPVNAESLALSGTTLFAAGVDGVSIIDVSSPEAPVLRGRYDTRSAQGIAAENGYLYVAEGYRGLTVVDVSRPSRPVVVSSCSDVFAVSVAVKGDFALVADSTGLKVVQILIPSWLQK